MTVTVGMCARCRHARQIDSARGSAFWLCRLSEVDPRFPKYPRLPVRECAGFARAGDDTPAPEDRRP